MVGTYLLADAASLLSGLEATAIGIGVVFLMLGILIGCVKLMTIGTPRPKQKEISHEPTVSLPAASEQSDVFTDDEGDVLRPEIVAAIVAAITMTLSAEAESGSASAVGFKVRKITQIK